MTRDDETPSVNPTDPTGQGAVPEQLPNVPLVPATSPDHLSGQEVTDLIGGGDASRAEANEALDPAEGITES
ncbi:hypothetical protein LAJ19_02170 [Deinococcus taeanensis]|uniref:hypothetical protein n=1 Tax=Deinococcus taeanensis TaxID=2737050 RepID=UPI001CDCBC6C|nr:hypothetical protein [Deinococcus taeanensis]UBV43052.1 hypothetical protein LAJ19_02170 [Deinococcus taeanensis]